MSSGGGLAVSAHGLGKRFGPVVAVDGLSFEVPQGSVFGFLGRNGAGKTVTIRMLAGITRPTAGTATVAGAEIGLNKSALQSRIGFLPDHPAFHDWMSGAENLVFAAELFGMTRGDAKRRAGELLDLVGLGSASERRVGGYSAGMRQRLGIAQALVNRPRLLIMDEPAAALDPIGRVEVLELIQRLKRDESTVFMSTHLLNDVERVCDHVAIIDSGRLVTQASVSELLARYARPIIEIELERAEPALLDRLATLDGVTACEDVSGIGTRFRAQAESDASRGALLSMLASSGLPVRRYQLAQPTLEDIFVQLVGSAPSPSEGTK